MMEDDLWKSPWADRYASKEILHLFGTRSRTYHWRLMWWYLAKAQHALGLPVTQEQVEDLESHLENIDFDAINAYEKEFKHDVMAHLHAFGDKASLAKPIIHLGATSTDITDNADMIIFRKALKIIERNLVLVIYHMKNFAHKYKDVVTLGYTHFQSATATTVGKRTTLWIESLLNDLQDVKQLIEVLPLKGFKGATGTAESYHNLFNGNYINYSKMENLILEYTQFDRVQTVAGQTYDRKWDVKVLAILNQIAISAHKISNDFRLLQHLQEFEEPMSRKQVGSSAMAYKRNPMKAERISSLAKWVSSLYSGAVSVASTQWLERTLDDSAIRRLNIPQAFFGVDALLRIMQVVMTNAKIYEKVIAMHLKRELPFLQTEKIIMEMVQAGGNRQEAHEVIRKATHTMMQILKEQGKEIDLIDILTKDPACNLSYDQLKKILSSENICGFAKEQSQNFLNTVTKILEEYESIIANDAYHPSFKF